MNKLTLLTIMTVMGSFFLCLLLVNSLGVAQAAQTSQAQRTLDAYAPFEELIQVTASDVLIYDPPLRGCMIEVAGDIVLATIKGDSNVTLTVVVGQLVPAMITQVRATGTTAIAVCGR